MQVTDTPGVLSRDDDERNKMELLTLAALDCLPTSVLFVIDLTEECGTSIADQWAIRCGVHSDQGFETQMCDTCCVCVLFVIDLTEECGTSIAGLGNQVGCVSCADVCIMFHMYHVSCVHVHKPSDEGVRVVWAEQFVWLVLG